MDTKGVFVLAREMAWAKQPLEKVADLMDAVHDLPAGEPIRGREARIYLSAYDDKWGSHEAFTNISLVSVWRDCVR